jgi:hypothetical protein
MVNTLRGFLFCIKARNQMSHENNSTVVNREIVVKINKEKSAMGDGISDSVADPSHFQPLIQSEVQQNDSKGSTVGHNRGERVYIKTAMRKNIGETRIP